MTSYARRVDTNHAEVRDGLRRAGFDVLDLSRAGCGVSDLLVRKGGWWVFVEVKSKGGRLTPEEKKFLRYVGDAHGMVAYDLQNVLDAYNDEAPK